MRCSSLIAVFSDFQMKAAIQEQSNIGSVRSPPHWLVVLILSCTTTSETICKGGGGGGIDVPYQKINEKNT